jgi:hypothetical protein
VGTIYHFSTLRGIVHIINDNCLNGQDYDKPGVYSISFTRNKHFLKNDKREEQLGRDTLVGAFEVDGNLLSDKYKISPFQFQGGDVDDEDEERIYTNEIDNILKYVLKICIFKDKIKKANPNHLFAAMVNTASRSSANYIRGRAKVVEDLYKRLGWDYNGEDLPNDSFYGNIEEYEEIFYEMFYEYFEKFTAKNNIKLEIIKDI